MILVDANLLLYAYDTSSAHHDPARRWWAERLTRPDPVRIPWATIVAFLRIGTSARVLKWPMTLEEACGHVAAWLDRPMVDVVEPTSRHWEILQGLLVSHQASGNLVADAHLAALAIEHGATLCSSDHDFSRFPGLAWHNPLARRA